MNPLNYLNIPHDRKAILWLVFILAVIFLLLTLFVYLLPNSFIDVEFSEEIQEDRNPVLDFLMKTISWFGVSWVAPVLIGLTSLFFYLSGYRREALFVASTILSAAVAFVAKVAVNRPRPTADLVQIIEHAQFQSFPSGHTLFYVVFFGLLLFLSFRLERIQVRLRWGIGIVSVFMIFSVPFSRVYLGAHWLTDVLGGFLLGLLYLIATVYLYLRNEKKKVKTRKQQHA